MGPPPLAAAVRDVPLLDVAAVTAAVADCSPLLVVDPPPCPATTNDADDGDGGDPPSRLAAVVATLRLVMPTLTPVEAAGVAATTERRWRKCAAVATGGDAGVANLTWLPPPASGVGSGHGSGSWAVHGTTLNGTPTTPRGITAAAAAIAATAVTAAVAVLLAGGGDDRLTVVPSTGRNKYHVPPTVPPVGAVLRSSCTASPVSAAGAAAAAETLTRVWAGGAAAVAAAGKGAAAMEAEAEGVAMAMDAIAAETRRRLAASLGLPAGVAVVLTPSGSDAELLPLAAAVALSARRGAEVVSLVVAAGEVGSGTADAAGGAHFSTILPTALPADALAPAVAPGVAVMGFDTSRVRVVSLPARNASGTVPSPSATTDAVLDAVATADAAATVAGNPPPYIVLHAVDGSKTGLRVLGANPVEPAGVVDHLGADRCLLVVDACQGRTTPAGLRRWLEGGAVVLVTGSKFWGGPPFSGAVLLPPQVATLWQATDEGLADYLTTADVPPSLPVLRGVATRGGNVGLLLRWAAALAEMDSLSARVPGGLGGLGGEEVRKVVAAWVGGICQLVRERPGMEVLSEDGGKDSDDADDKVDEDDVTRLGGINTVVCVRLAAPSSGGPTDVHSNGTSDGTVPPLKWLGVPTLKRIHALLPIDASTALPPSASAADVRAAAAVVYAGQPVAVGKASGGGVLRLAASAALVCQLLGGEGQLEKALAADAMALDKMGVLAKWVDGFV
ncbi:hypothetical protein MMPV_001318 [Pyropia vietnamensis]